MQNNNINRGVDKEKALSAIESIDEKMLENRSDPVLWLERSKLLYQIDDSQRAFYVMSIVEVVLLRESNGVPWV